MAQGSPSQTDQGAPPDPPAPLPTLEIQGAPRQPIDKRVFGVLPNYRTVDGTLPFEPIPAKRKLWIAAKDSFDWPVYLTSGLFATLYQLENQNPSFGQGMAGYSKRFATAYGDQMLGNMMTEGFMPSLFHQDPRYFRRGYGTTKSRLWYAATRIFVCKTDEGRPAFNFSEVVGNSAATAIGNAYYPDTRTAGDNLTRLAIALATDSASQIAKEFWPDVKRKVFHKKTTQ
jgi:hypothetical protein